MEQKEVVGAKAEAKIWKTGLCKKELQKIEILSVFDLKLFFFIKAFLGKTR